MKLIYDLGIKFAGLAAFCGMHVTDANIGAALFGQNLGDTAYREAVSRIKAGERAPSIEARIGLTEYFNSLISKANLPSSRSGNYAAPLRPEDWDRPVTDFFAEVAYYFTNTPEALNRAHAAIMEELNKLDEFRDRATPLGVTRYVGQSLDRSRFPATAVAVDSITLPVMKFGPQDKMLIELIRPVERPSNGWMFFIRNPDARTFGDSMNRRVWEQPMGEIIRWHPSPFPLERGFFGVLPAYPSAIEPLDGEYTVYLLVEDLAALGVRRTLIGKEAEREGRPFVPSYEATMHLISRARTVFQRSNKGMINYEPPSVMMRRYRVSGG